MTVVASTKVGNYWARLRAVEYPEPGGRHVYVVQGVIPGYGPLWPVASAEYALARGVYDEWARVLCRTWIPEPDRAFARGGVAL